MQRHSVLYTYLGLLLFTLLPVFLFPYPILWDHLNHVARIEILHKLADSQDLQQFYEANWTVIPGLVYDAFVYGLSFYLPVTLSARIFIALTIFLFTSGAMFLQRQISGRWQAWPLAIFLFAWNGMLISGSLNYMFGAGALLWVAGLWVGLRDQTSLFRRTVLFTVLGIGLFFCHLVIFIIWGLWLACDELLRQRRLGTFSIGEWLGVLAQAIIPVWLFLDSAPLAQDQGGIDYGRWWLLKPVGIALTYDALNGLLLSFVIMAALAGSAIFALRRGWLTLRPTEGGMVALLGLLFLTLPHAALSNYAVDTRMLIVGAALFIAGSTPREVPQKLAYGAFLALVMFCVHKTALYSLQLEYFHQQLAYYEQAFEELPPGARLLPARLRYEPRTGQGRLALRGNDVPPACKSDSSPKASYDEAYQYHMMLSSVGALAASHRELFYSNLFTHPGKQPLRVKPPFDRISEPGDVMPDLCRVLSHQPDPRSLNSCRDPERCFWGRWEKDFDYILAIDSRRHGHWPYDPELELIVENPRFHLYRIRK